MSGLFSITFQEARGLVALSGDIDKLAVVIGCNSGPDGLSAFFLNGAAAVTALGYGDAVDDMTQMIEQRLDSAGGNKVPVAFYGCPTGTAGAYGTIDVTGVTGTSVVTNDAAVKPYGTYEAKLVVVAGGTIGMAGITLKWSLDDGRNFSRVTALGTANSFTIPNSNVKFSFAAGTLVAGDTVKVRTKAPMPDATGVADAFTAIANGSIDVGIVVVEWECTATLAATITTGLNAMASRGKDATAITRTRIRDFETAETEATWAAAVEADFANFNDDRVHVRAAYDFTIDAMTSRQYFRAELGQFAADLVRVPRFAWPCAPADRATPNALLVDALGVTYGHDEGPRGALTGLSDESQGNRFGCQMRLPDPTQREAVFNTVPWVMFASGGRTRNVMVRRLVNAMKRIARAAAIPQLGALLFYTPTSPGNGTLTETSRLAVQGAVYQALKDSFANEIDNANDASPDSGLVQIAPAVTVTGGNLLNLTATIAPRVGGFVLTETFTIAVQE